MPKIHGITYRLDGDKQVYRPGEIVSGTWTVDLGESFTIRGIRTSLEGMAYTRWHHLDRKKDDKISKENITRQWKTVFGKKLGEDGPNPTVEAGVHKYRFSFKIPENGVPSSYEGEYGAVRYWLRIQIDRPILRFNIDRYKVITVLDHVDVNTPELNKFVGRRTEKKISKLLGIGDQGSVTFHAQSDRGGYCPGEKIAISLLANNESEKDLGVIKASLIQTTKFIASDEEKTKDKVLRTLTGITLLKKSKKTWSNQLLSIDAVPPSSRDRTCHIIKVSYFVKVSIDVPLLQGGDIVLNLPITIGTVPQGYKRPSSSVAASNITEVDLSSTITYTECNKGLERFTESGSGFPNLTYTPWCAYVPNFRFKQSQKSSATITYPKQSTKAASPKPMRTTSATATPSRTTTATATPSRLTTATAMSSSVTRKPSAPSLSQPPQAGPLPTKSGLPTPSIVLPTNLPASGYAYPEPSAPSIEIMPPSYEEVMAEMTGLVPEQAQEVVPDSSSTQSSDDEEGKPTRKTTFIIVRFPDNFIVEFREKLKETSELLKKFSGEVIALAPQVIVNRGTWPPRTSVAVFLFESQNGGKQWFEEFTANCRKSNIEILDSVLGATREESQNEKSTFSLSLVTITANYKSKEWKRYVSLALKQLKPLRLEIGGIQLSATKLLTSLLGSWPDSRLTMTMNQWESITQIYDYKSKIETDKFKEVNELRKKFFAIETTVFFQTEDLTFLEDSTSDPEPSSLEDDDRQEAA